MCPTGRTDQGEYRLLGTGLVVRNSCRDRERADGVALVVQRGSVDVRVRASFTEGLSRCGRVNGDRAGQARGVAHLVGAGQGVAVATTGQTRLGNRRNDDRGAVKHAVAIAEGSGFAGQNARCDSRACIGEVSERSAERSSARGRRSQHRRTRGVNGQRTRHRDRGVRNKGQSGSDRVAGYVRSGDGVTRGVARRTSPGKRAGGVGGR